MRIVGVRTEVHTEHLPDPILFYYSVVGTGTMLQAGRPRVRFSMRLLDFSVDLNHPASRPMALGSTQSNRNGTRNLPGGKGRPARKANNLAICEPIV
jgi:hypothetical protein